MPKTKSTYEDILKDLADFLNQLDDFYMQNELSRKENKELESILHSEQAEKIREQRYRLLTEHTSDVIILHDSSGKIQYVSPAVENLTGYKTEEFKGLKFYDSVYYKDIKEVKEKLVDLNKRKEEVTYEYRMVTKSKQIIWVETKTRTLRDSRKKIRYWISSTRDISDRKRAEENIRDSEELFRTSIENLIDAFGIFSAIRNRRGKIIDFRIEYVNKAACEINQITREEQVGLRLLELFPGKKDTDLFDKYCHLVETGKPVIERSLVYKNYIGKKYHEKVFDIQATRLKDGFVASWRDITEQKQVERTKKMVEKAIASAIHGFAIADKDGYLTYVNKAFIKNWRYSSLNEVIGKPAVNFWKEPELAENIIQKLEQYGRVIDELEAKRKDGTTFPVRITASRFIDEDERNPYILSSFFDMTEIKEAERVLKENERILKEKNIAKNKFFSIIAHDLKNPFNSIIGFTEILKRSIHDKNWEDFEKYADIIYSESRKTLDLLDNLLNWSRSQDGRIKYFPEKIDVRNLIMKVSSLLMYAADQKNIRINHHLQPGLRITADRNMMKMVIRNLVSNAIKFTNEGGEIIIRDEIVDNKVKISVCDNGVGMRKKDLNKLFKIESGFSTKGTKSEAGTGLGLILCKEFIEKHGGEIWAESEFGKGSTFSFTIPLKHE